MRNRFDWLGKQIGKAALGPCGLTEVQGEVTSETLYADILHEPNPACEAERKRLGLLGRLASSLCLIELYGHAPKGLEFRACLNKHLAFWQGRARKYRQAKDEAKKKRDVIEPFVEPFLWIVTAGRPTALLRDFKTEPASGWPQGVLFFGGDSLRVGFIIAGDLPLERSTLLVRLMAAGPLLPRAIGELAALRADAPERAVAERILLDLNQVLGKKSRKSRREQEFVMTMLQTWEDVRTEGRTEGRSEGERTLLLRQLRVRFGDLPAAVVSRIADAGSNEIERWGERVLFAQSIDEVFE